MVESICSREARSPADRGTALTKEMSLGDGGEGPTPLVQHCGQLRRQSSAEVQKLGDGDQVNVLKKTR
jgi:hypothetical protein